MTTQTKPVEENVTISDEMRTLFDELGIADLSPEMRDFLVNELGEQVIERVIIQIIKDLPEAKVNAFLEFMAKDASQESLYIYLTSIYPDIENVIQKTAREIVEEFKAGMQE